MSRSQRISRRVLRRRRAWTLVVMSVLLAIGAYTVVVMFAPAPAVTAETITPHVTAASPPALPSPGFGGYAIGAAGFPDPFTGEEAKTPRPMASITKLVTALVVLQAKPWKPGQADPTVTITPADAAAANDIVAQDGVVLPMTAGQTFTLNQVLTAMLLPSANNYAVALANWGFGSVSAYVDAARRWLSAQKLPTITVVDANGLDVANVASPADLVRLGALALADPAIANLVSQTSAVIPGIGSVTNTNRLLGRDGVVGVKTGTLDGRSNLLFARQVMVGTHQETMIGAILGGPDAASVAAAAWKLLSAAPAGMHEVAAVSTSENYVTYHAAWGTTVTARAASPVTVVVWGNTPITVSVSANPVGPGAAGRAVGRATVTVSAGGPTTSVDIVLAGALDSPTFGWTWTHPALLWR